MVVGGGGGVGAVCGMVVVAVVVVGVGVCIGGCTRLMHSRCSLRFSLILQRMGNIKLIPTTLPHTVAATV